MGGSVMREIKFRAWDKHTNDKNLRMWEWDEFRYSYMNDIFDDRYDRFELMQYTGFMRNEKEIYEDDICESLDGRFLIVWNDEKAAFEMMFQDGERLYLEEMWEDTKVIGNIHDNLDLWEVV